jgi:hypothetical protein
VFGGAPTAGLLNLVHGHSATLESRRVDWGVWGAQVGGGVGGGGWVRVSRLTSTWCLWTSQGDGAASGAPVVQVTASRISRVFRRGLALNVRKFGPSKWRMRVAGPISPHSESTPDSFTPTLCLTTCTERDAAAECLRLSIRKIGPPNWRMRLAAPMFPHSVLTRNSVTPACCLENRAGRDAALG